MSLSVNCLEWEEDSLGNKQLGIRWIPAKNGKEGLKWVPSCMQDIVVEAVKRLTNISSLAREVAKFAEENPNILMLSNKELAPSHSLYQKHLTKSEIAEVLDIDSKNICNTKWFKNLISENDGIITYEILGKFLYKKYTSKFNNWPYVDKHKSVKVSEALLLFRENEFHDDFSPKSFSFVLPTVNQINDRFCYSETRPKTSLWEKHCIGTSKGEFIRLPSHNARHWLSTKAERGGMDELTLANWAGRARVADNRAYDHRTEEEKSESVRDLLIPEDISILDKIRLNLPVTYEDLGKDRIGIATVTEIGICEHDYAMSPCSRHGDCETCKELVCIKGLESSLEMLKQREIQLTEQFSKAKEHHRIGVFGADRWISNLGWRLTHIKTKIKFLENSEIPNGSLFRMPDEYDPSPVKLALQEKGMDIDIQKTETAKLDDELYRLMELCMPKILITEENLEDIIMMIKTWEGKLTWDLLCSKVSELLNVKSIERQSLANYPDIQKAFSKQKQKVKEKAKANPEPNITMDYLQKQVNNLKAQVQRLEEINERYKQQFIVWQYNAYMHGMTQDTLNKPLIAVNRQHR